MTMMIIEDDFRFIGLKWRELSFISDYYLVTILSYIPRTECEWRYRSIQPLTTYLFRNYRHAVLHFR